MRVCLLTPGQPSNNPRLVKEANTLSNEGHIVHVICTDSGLWPSETDKDLLAQVHWSCEYVGGIARTNPTKRLWTRARRKLAQRGLRLFSKSTYLQTRALSRATPEIEAAAFNFPADMYIAHHPTVLPCAVAAAANCGGKVGYDAEDFYSGMWRTDEGVEPADQLISFVEHRWLKSCDYVTASAPRIADAYVQNFGIKRPTPVLNVFSLAERPKSFRHTDSSGILRLYWFSQCIGTNRGIEDAVRAIAILKDCQIELHLRGNWQNGYKERLTALAQSVGIASRLHEHPPASPDEMTRLASTYDVGLATEPSISRNNDLCLSNKIFTYILAGNALIGTRTAAQDEFLNSLGVAAGTYDSGDIETLAEHLRKLHGDRILLDAARRCAWDWGTRRYNWDVEQRTLLELIASTCSKKQRVWA
jgi:glycosyltransferase involved in cell wall biosynthesis